VKVLRLLPPSVCVNCPAARERNPQPYHRRYLALLRLSAGAQRSRAENQIDDYVVCGRTGLGGLSGKVCVGHVVLHHARPIGRFRYIAWVKCPYRVAGKASALHMGKRAPG
jgi:hypothetical protein